MISRQPLSDARVGRSRRSYLDGRLSRVALCCIVLGSCLCLAGALLAARPAASSPHLGDSLQADQSGLIPAQGDQLYTFTACNAPDGSSCLSPYGGVDTPLEVGTTVSLEWFTSIFATPPLSGTINWGDGSQVQSQDINSGQCQCMFGPFTHTYNSAGSFTIVIYDSADGSETVGTITVSATASLFSFNGLLIIFGGLLGLGGLVGGLASMRGPRLPSGSPSIPPPSIPVPVTYGNISTSPTGTGGTAIQSTLQVPPAPGMPPGGWPPWAFDYRTTPYQPNPLYQGWGELLQRFQLEHQGKPPAPPNWPFLTNPAPPTNFVGVFCQPRINPQTGQWAWWNPVDGTFPSWG